MNETPAARLEVFGDEGLRVLVIDDAHPDPEALIRAAEPTEDFAAPPSDLYPGVRKPAPPAFVAALLARHQDALAAAFPGASDPAVEACTFSLATADPARLAPVQRLPHVDTAAPGLLAVVHYLCGPDHGGTAFYRHRATGFEYLDDHRAHAYRRALHADLRRHGLPAPAYIAGDTPLFQHVHAVAARFNRAIVYHAHGFHSGDLAASPALPRHCRRGRLTLNALLRYR